MLEGIAAGEAGDLDRESVRHLGAAIERRLGGRNVRKLAVWLGDLPEHLEGAGAAVAELLARGVEEGGYEPQTIYRESVDAAPPPLERPREAQTPRAIAPEQVYNTALQTFRSREHGQAVLDFLDFIAKYPRHPLAANAQYWIGEAYYAQRDYRQALVEFQKVFEYGPAKAPDALVKMGLCWVKLRDVRRAQDLWQRALREYPRSEAAATAQQLLHTHAAAQR